MTKIPDSAGFLFTMDRKFILRIFFYFSATILIGNMNALVDVIVHPEIPYLDNEHLIVGGITAIVAAILFGVIEREYRKIKILEGLLPICANCKKIRDKENQWHILESYIMKKTHATFTHGICPDCQLKLYGKIIG